MKQTHKKYAKGIGIVIVIFIILAVGSMVAMTPEVDVSYEVKDVTGNREVVYEANNKSFGLVSEGSIYWIIGKDSEDRIMSEHSKVTDKDELQEAGLGEYTSQIGPNGAYTAVKFDFERVYPQWVMGGNSKEISVNVSQATVSQWQSFYVLSSAVKVDGVMSGSSQLVHQELELQWSQTE